MSAFLLLSDQKHQWGVNAVFLYIAFCLVLQPSLYHGVRAHSKRRSYRLVTQQ